MAKDYPIWVLRGALAEMLQISPQNVSTLLEEYNIKTWSDFLGFLSVYWFQRRHHEG